jgi:hypothetical protein
LCYGAGQARVCWEAVNCPTVMVMLENWQPVASQGSESILTQPRRNLGLNTSSSVCAQLGLFDCIVSQGFKAVVTSSGLQAKLVLVRLVISHAVRCLDCPLLNQPVTTAPLIYSSTYIHANIQATAIQTAVGEAVVHWFRGLKGCFSVRSTCCQCCAVAPVSSYTARLMWRKPIKHHHPSSRQSRTCS